MPKDFTTKPYSKWIENIIQDLFDLDPESIAVQLITKTGVTATCYYNMNNNLRIKAISAIISDCVIDWIQTNASFINDLLDDEEEDDNEDN